MPWETKTRIEDDPCLSLYPTRNVTDREVHVNVRINQVRVYVRAGQKVHTFGPTIDGQVTIDMARAAGWCHIHSVTFKSKKTGKGLLNFVGFCPKREIGFHSTLWIKNNKEVPIPNSESAGCIRIPHADSREFYNLVQDGDGVRIYERDDWRPPLFAFGSIADHCKETN